MFRLVFALLAICLFSSFVLAQGPGQQIDSAEFTVHIGTTTNGAPQWTFWQNDNASYVYKVGLRYLFEAENMTSSVINAVANSQTYPQGTGWGFTSATTVNGSSSVGVVNNNPKGPLYPNGQYRFNQLSFNSTVPLGSVNGSAYSAGKFDIDIQGYQWVSMNEEAQLIFVFSLDYELNGYPGSMTSENITSHGSRTANVLGSYFSINSTAMGGPGKNVTTDVALKFPSSYTGFSGDVGAQDIWIVFDHFDSDCHHDPEFGFGKGPGNSYIWIIIIVVVVIAIIVIILIAVIGFILVRRRRRSYDAF